MTNQEILIKAIKKTIAGGWSEHLEASAEDWIEGFREDDMSDEMVTAMAGTLIFNHDFAKALWGTECIFQSKGSGHSHFSGAPTALGCTLAWQYHLQQMVIADDPIAYLGENI